jgi:hypothetical protein
MKIKYLLVACIFIAATANAQSYHYTQSDYAARPVWIEMIKDTSINFFESEKAFNTYFQHHEQPGGEHDIIGERGVKGKRLSKRVLRKMQADDQMRMEVKKYERWHDKVLPFVQSDGSILTPTQRLKLWNDQRSK